jgi:hypothetical protein
MDFFAEFNNFQKEIFKNVFANPFQNQSSTSDAQRSREKIKVEQSIQITVKKESPSQRQTKRKRRASSNFIVDEISNLESAKSSVKLNKSETRILLEEKSKTLHQVNIYETPRKSFLIPLNDEINEKGVRRGRSKFRASKVGMNELPVKVFNEMCQEEFLFVFGLKRMI